MSGVFIALEGIEGSGKSTVARRLAAALHAAGRKATVTREPGGTSIGESIRALVLDGDASSVTAETEALLFAASRAQLVAEVIRPALARGDDVVVDRFVDSSLAYQWGGRGLPLDEVRAVQELATGGLEPDVKILLDLPVPLGLARRFSGQGRSNRLDRESAAFHERVREAYHSLAAADPQRWRVIDASLAEDAVWRDVWGAVSGFEAIRTNLPHDAVMLLDRARP